jgi:NAD(P)-dependent dehydrogenase (short-subunit alcohol dehydrogenase family)/uncharacterized protein (DUF952 family)
VRIFHIAEPATWARARPSGDFTMSTRGRTLEEEGFIHCSQPQQVALVLDAVYADLEHDLLLLVIDTDLLASPWQLDDVPGADDPFPHIYGPLNASAVVDELVLRRTADGFVVPDLTDAPQHRVRGSATSGFGLEGTVALVTGASSGLGERFSTVLAEAGADLVVTGRRADRLEQLAARLGTAVTVVPGDLRDPAFRTALVRRAESVHGRLDVLVNNAGTCDGGPIEDQRLDELSDVLDLDLVAPLDLCRLAAPLLFAATSASVVNVASIFGLVASREPMAAYNVSKAGLVGLTRQLAAEWGDRGVRVNALAPGFFPTDLTGGLSDRGQRAAIARRTLLGRTPDPSELDGPLLFLASAASSYVTGQVLTVDGGWTAV